MSINCCSLTRVFCNPERPAIARGVQVTLLCVAVLAVVGAILFGGYGAEIAPKIFAATSSRILAGSILGGAAFGTTALAIIQLYMLRKETALQKAKANIVLHDNETVNKEQSGFTSTYKTTKVHNVSSLAVSFQEDSHGGCKMMITDGEKKGHLELKDRSNRPVQFTSFLTIKIKPYYMASHLFFVVCKSEKSTITYGLDSNYHYSPQEQVFRPKIWTVD